MTLELVVLWSLAVAALTMVYVIAMIVADKIQVWLLRRDIKRIVKEQRAKETHPLDLIFAPDLQTLTRVELDGLATAHDKASRRIH